MSHFRSTDREYLPMQDSANLETRRYDLDWLRIIAFGLLIFYHIGMFYVSWGWHVKSVYSGTAIEPVMRLLNPWRLSLLFFISGVALRFAMDKASVQKRGLLKFTGLRTWKLLLPIMFGIHVIVAPQSWLQLLETGEISSGFWQFYPEYLIGTTERYSVTIPTWNHLWYVVYLMLYTLILAPLAKPLSQLMRGTGARITQSLFSHKFRVLCVLTLPVIPHLLFRFLLDQRFPTTHDVVTDWANHAHSFTFLLTGYLLAKDQAFWNTINQAFKPALLLSIILGISLSFIWVNWDWFIKTETVLWPARAARVFYIWIVIAALCGAAQKWLNKPSPVLSYMTEAIFPWYILHQTLTIMAGYWLTRQGMSLDVEFSLVTLATFGGCLIIHELFIRRWALIRPFFGLKITPAKFK